MKQIQIIIGPDGQTRLETTGFAGTECQEASRLLEQALGFVTSDVPTSSRYASQPSSDSLSQQLNAPAEH